MCMATFCECMSVLGAYKDQERMSDPLELKLNVVAGHHMGAGT